MTSASTSAQTLAFAWDALGRQLSQTDGSRIYSSQYDLAGRRTRLTHPDGFYVDQDYLVTGEMVKIRENGATSGIGVLATYGYDDLGRRTSLTFGNGESASYSYDAVSRLSQLVRNLGGSVTTNDLTLTFAYNPASQISSTNRSNDLYAWTGHGNGTTSTTADGLNRIASWNGTLTYDSRGNLASDGTLSYSYDSENRLADTSSTIPYHYDPLGRLAGAGSPIAIHYENYVDGLIAEKLPSSSGVSMRHVFGPGTDEPIVWYVGSGTSDRRFLHADEHGSIVAVTDSSANLLAINRYDEYGKTQTSGTNYGRFLYTGQRYFGGIGLYYYKNRFYHPSAGGRFLQPDPIGYGGGMNLYAYVGGDPVNFADPMGLTPQAVICTGTRLGCPVHHDSGGSGLNPASSGTSEHVGQANWAAIKRDPNPVPWTGTGTLTTYSDGTQALTNATITFGGRFQGLTASGNSAVAFALSAGAHTGIYFRVSPQNDKDVWVGYSQLPMSARQILANRTHLPSGSVEVDVPIDYVVGAAAGNGFVFRPIRSAGDANIFRVMAPNRFTPYPYIVFHNDGGQPISPFSGRTLSRDEWHYRLTGVRRTPAPW